MQLVIRIKKAGQLGLGDRVLAGDIPAPADGTVIAANSPLLANTRTVGSAKAGTKNATVRDTEGKSLLYVANDTPVAVVATEETLEEQEARHEARVRRTLEETLEQGLRDYSPTKLLTDAMETVARRGESRVIFNMADALLQGQAHFDFLSRVQSYYAEGGTRVKGDILMSFAAALIQARDGDRYRSPLSRSTSLTSNLQEDLARWAPEQYLDGMGGGGDLLRAKVYQLELERLGR